jgi:hypothetical protein
VVQQVLDLLKLEVVQQVLDLLKLEVVQQVLDLGLVVSPFAEGRRGLAGCQRFLPQLVQERPGEAGFQI